LKTIDRLENILAEYEDFLWLLRLIATIGGGDVSHVPQPWALRKALVERNTNDSMQICSDLFDAGEAWKFAFDCASDIADWCIHSKRIFSLSDSLCQMLLATDLPDFSAENIKFVSQAYVVQLEKPVVCANGRTHDFILCSYCPNTHVLSVRSYPQTYNEYHPLTEEKKRLVEKNVRRGNPRFQEFVSKITSQAAKRFVVGYSCFLLGKDTAQKSISESAPADEKEEWGLIFQLALGVNLYLQSARGSDIEVVHEVKSHASKGSKRQPITSGAKLFELATSSAFAPSGHTGSSDNEPKGSVRPHFRRGYWRRPSGFGDDPSVPATIWVRPTWVRMDKIVAGEQPIGSSQSVTIVE